MATPVIAVEIPRNRYTRSAGGLAHAAARLFCLFVIVLAACWTQPSHADDDVLVFAAASLKPALDTLLAMPEAQAIGAIQVSYAASSQLARQIEHGAPASIFISADQDWMNHLEKRELIVRETRIDLFGNALVLIAPADSTVTLDLAPDVDLLGALGPNGQLAIAEPDSVPAGKYAKAALASLDIWPSVEARTIRAGDVRAALNFVARQEAPLGIVYRSDAVSTPAVRIVDTFDTALHAPIVYPAAVIQANDSPASRAVMSLLESETADAIFMRFGFTAVVKRKDGDRN